MDKTRHQCNFNLIQFSFCRRLGQQLTSQGVLNLYPALFISKKLQNNCFTKGEKVM